MARIVEKISFKALAETMLFEVLSPPKPNMRAIFEIMTSPHHVLCYMHNFWIILKLFSERRNISRIIDFWKICTGCPKKNTLIKFLALDKLAALAPIKGLGRGAPGVWGRNCFSSLPKNGNKLIRLVENVL